MTLKRRPAALAPATIIEMVEALDDFHGRGTGMRIAAKLMLHFGGLEVKFPKVPAQDHPVVVALGMDDATILCQHLDGSQIYVPMAKRSPHRAVLDLERAGRSRAEIARALGLSIRHVRHLANTRREPVPLPLFPED